jgi:hypothetical protein
MVSGVSSGWFAYMQCRTNGFRRSGAGDDLDIACLHDPSPLSDFYKRALPATLIVALNAGRNAGSQCGPSHNKGRQAVSKEITMLKGVLITARAFAFAAFAGAVTGLRRNGRSSEV